MKSKSVFLLVGIFILLLRNIDFINGYFYLYAEGEDFYDQLSVLLITVWIVVVCAVFPPKERKWLFIRISLYFMLEHPFWGYLHVVVDVPTLAIKDSLPYIVKAYEFAISRMDLMLALFHVSAALVAYLYCYIVAACAWILKILYIAFLQPIVTFLTGRRNK